MSDPQLTDSEVPAHLSTWTLGGQTSGYHSRQFLDTSTAHIDIWPCLCDVMYDISEDEFCDVMRMDYQRYLSCVVAAAAQDSADGSAVGGTNAASSNLGEAAPVTTAQGEPVNANVGLGDGDGDSTAGAGDVHVYSTTGTVLTLSAPAGTQAQQG